MPVVPLDVRSLRLECLAQHQADRCLAVDAGAALLALAASAAWAARFNAVCLGHLRMGSQVAQDCKLRRREARHVRCLRMRTHGRGLQTFPAGNSTEKSPKTCPFSHSIFNVAD